MTAYYNEIDKHAAEWLRQLIKDGLIAPGDVDERDIKDVTPDDIRHYTQCHFFAGIGGWSRALRLAGWSDDRPVWTASCPCQPFSSAGKQQGTSDERHLWPVFFDLVKECQPVCILGEQVASKAALEWFDGVSADLEGIDYPCGAIDLPAAGIGAPHIRQRLFWVAHSEHVGHDRSRGVEAIKDSDGQNGWVYRGSVGGVADSHGQRCDGQQVPVFTGRPQQTRVEASGGSGLGWMGNTASSGCTQSHGTEQTGQHGETGHWGRFTTIPCGDGKTRRIEPGLAPLVDGVPRGVVSGGDPRSSEYAQATAEARVMRLRGYGNAINPIVAAEFIKAYLETGGQP